METNKITLAGFIGDITYSHSTLGEDFYDAYISVRRESEATDELRLVIPSVIASNLVSGNEYTVHGEIRTRNDRENTKKKLDVFVFVKEVGEYAGYDINEAEFIGFVCKKPIIRKTPFGRTITDYLLAVNRQFGKSDYIPCISWGRSAVRMENVEVGTKILVRGRMQSRVYNKRLSETESEERVAYELSTSLFEIMGAENEN